MKVIVDTTAWYGYFVKSDKFHDESVAFIDTKPEIIISNIIFEEVLALLHHRVSKKFAAEAGKTVLGLCAHTTPYVSAEENEDIMRLYAHSMQYIDYVDASIVWLSRKFDLPVFTFDEHFK